MGSLLGRPANHTFDALSSGATLGALLGETEGAIKGVLLGTEGELLGETQKKQQLEKK